MTHKYSRLTLFVTLLAVVALAGIIACAADESAEDIAKAVQAQMGPQLTASDVREIVSESAGPQLTAADVQSIVMESTGQQLTATDVQRIVDASTSGQLTAADVQSIVRDSTGQQLTAADVQRIVEASVGSQLTANDVQKIVDASASGQLTAADVQRIVSESQLTATDVQRIVDASAQGQLTAADVQQIVSDSQLTASDVQNIVDASAQGQLTAADVQRIVSESQLTAADVEKIVDASMMGQLSTDDVQKIVNQAVMEIAPDQPEKVLNIRIAQTYPTLLPHTAGSSGLALLYDLVYSRLLMPNPATSQWNPDLAERWEVAPDASSYTFYIRKHATWHDGMPVTARDVAFTIKSMMTPDTGTRRSAAYTVIKGAQDFIDGNADDVEGIVLLDDHTIRFDMQEPTTVFLGSITDLRRPILPAHIYEDVDPAELPTHPTMINEAIPIGSGPFKFVEHVSDQFLVVEANDDYFFGRPSIDRIVIHMIPSRDAALIAAQRGEIDVLYHGLTPDGYDVLIRDARWTVKAMQGSTICMHAFNDRIGWLKDPRVREAWLVALDRPALVRTFRAGNGTIFNSPFVHSWYQEMDWMDRFQHDPDRARELLAEAGWDTGRTIEILTGIPRDDNAVAQAAAIQQMLQDVGFKIEYLQLDGPARSAKEADGDWHVSSGCYNVFADPDGFLSRWHLTGADLRTGYNSAGLDEKILAGRAAITPRERAAIYQDIAEQFMTDLVYAPLSMSHTWYAHNKNVKFPHFANLPDPTSLYDVPVAPAFNHRLNLWKYHPEQWDIDVE